MHNEQLMGIRGEEEMEMSDDDMEAANSKDSEDSGKHIWADTQQCSGADWGRMLVYDIQPAIADMTLVFWLEGEYNLYNKETLCALIHQVAAKRAF